MLVQTILIRAVLIELMNNWRNLRSGTKNIRWLLNKPTISLTLCVISCLKVFCLPPLIGLNQAVLPQAKQWTFPLLNFHAMWSLCTCKIKVHEYLDTIFNCLYVKVRERELYFTVAFSACVSKAIPRPLVTPVYSN